MLTHETIWLAIDRLAESRGYSPSGLAKKAGLDPTTFNKSKRLSADGKPRWPSTESLAKILDVTNAGLSEFLGLTAAPPPGRPPLLEPGAPVAVGLRDGGTVTGRVLRHGANLLSITPDAAPSGQADIKARQIAWIARIVHRTEDDS